MLQHGNVADVPATERLKILSIRSPVDAEFDSLPQIGAAGYGSTTARGVDIQDALRRFAVDHPGQHPATASQLQPYLKWPLRDPAIQSVLDVGRTAAP